MWAGSWQYWYSTSVHQNPQQSNINIEFPSLPWCHMQTDFVRENYNDLNLYMPLASYIVIESSMINFLSHNQAGIATRFFFSWVGTTFWIPRTQANAVLESTTEIRKRKEREQDRTNLRSLQFNSTRHRLIPFISHKKRETFLSQAILLIFRVSINSINSNSKWIPH